MKTNDAYTVQVYGNGAGDWRLVPRSAPRLVTGLETRDSLPTRDRILEAVPSAKMAAGTLWQGDLKPRFDYLLDEIKTLVSGFTLNQTLTPEGPGRELDLGRIWDGLSKLEAAVRDARVALAVSQDKATSDARSRVRDTPAVVGSFGKPTSPSTVNQINREFWRRQTTADHSSAAASPSSTPNTIASINEANRKFWAQRSQ